MNLKKVLQIKKSIIDTIKNELIIIDKEIRNKKDNIDKLNKETKNFTLGNVKIYYEFLIFRNMIENIRFTINQEKSELDDLCLKKNIINQKLKEAMIEYEKIAYINNIEIDNKKKILNKKEQNELDDISGILQYTRKIL